MNKEYCLVVGNIRTGEYEGLASYGITILLISDIKKVSKHAQSEEMILIDTYDFEKGYSKKLQRLVDITYEKFKFTSVLNFRESYVQVTEDICKNHPYLNGMHQNISITLNKKLQRERFLKCNNKDLHVFSSEINLSHGIESFRDYRWPCIIKPATLYSSLFVKVLNNFDDLASYYQNEWNYLKDYVKDKTRENETLLIEEYIEGSNHSIDCAISPEGDITTFPIVDVITGNDIGRKDLHHFARYSPSILDNDDLTVKRCQQMAFDAIESLRIKGTFAHVEFIMTREGPKILEVASRPGGSRIFVLREAWGIDMDYFYHCALSGKTICFKKEMKKNFAIVTPFSRKNIIWNGLKNLNAVSSINGFKREYNFICTGEEIGPVCNGFQNYLYLEFSCITLDRLRLSISETSKIDFFGEENRPSIIIVGGNDSSINWPDWNLFDFTLIQPHSKVTKYQQQHANIIYSENLSINDDWFKILEERNKEKRYSAAVSFNEEGLLLASEIGKKLGICHNPIRSVKLSRDKSKLRVLLQNTPWSVPFKVICDEVQAHVFIQKFGRSIIKPINGSGSRGIQDIDLKKCKSKLTINQKVLIEKFIFGDEYSIETLTLNGKHQFLGITKKFTTGTPNHVESGHNFPAELSSQIKESIINATTVLLELIGHKWGPAHTEFKINGNDISFIETQTRFGGDQIWEMVWLTTGTHQARETISAMSGLELSLCTPKFRKMAIRFIIDKKTISNPIRNSWLIREIHHNGKIKTKITCSSDRQGYYLYGCDNISEKDFEKEFYAFNPPINQDDGDYYEK